MIIREEYIDWKSVIKQNKDEIIDALMDLGKQAYGRPQKDLYLYLDGEIEVFNNVGGNSWINNDRLVIWTTADYEYANVDDNIYTDDFIEMFKRYTDKDVDKFLQNMANDYDYDSINELIRYESGDVQRKLKELDKIAYDELITDLLNDEFDLDWANSVLRYTYEHL